MCTNVVDIHVHVHVHVRVNEMHMHIHVLTHTHTASMHLLYTVTCSRYFSSESLDTDFFDSDEASPTNKEPSTTKQVSSLVEDFAKSQSLYLSHPVS